MAVLKALIRRYEEKFLDKFIKDFQKVIVADEKNPVKISWYC